MRAIVISAPGGPDVLKLSDVPAPAPGPEEVLVRVRATALNRADLLQRRGRYPGPRDVVADIPGLEFAGEIERCGDRVQTFRTGDRVMGIVGGGGYAERVALHERLCMPVSPGLSWTEAAAIPEAFLTAYDALFEQGRLVAGERVLIHAAGSGVGCAALQLAAAAGARTVALSRSADKRARLAGLAAGEVLDPAAPDLVDAIGAGGGVHLVLDLVGAPMWKADLAVLRERGRMVLIGLLGGARVEADLWTLMRKRLTVVGSVLRSRSTEEKTLLVQRFAERILPLIAAGRVRPLVDRVLPLRQAGEAHQAMERNENLGKIVLLVDDES